MLLLAVVGSVLAVDVTVPAGGSPINVNAGTITFDTALTADQGSTQGGLVPAIAFNSGVLGTPFYTGVNLDHGMGEIISGFNNVNGSAIDLTNGPATVSNPGGGSVAPRTGIRASWSNRYLLNRPGDDFVITDNGNAGGVEYFVIVAKPLGAAASNFYYSPADAFQDSNTTDDFEAGINPIDLTQDVGDFLTAVDLSDLGYNNCTTFEYIEIWEMLAADRFDSSGFGFVGAGSTERFRPPVMDSIPTGALSAFYDADIGFIFAVDSTNLGSPRLETTTTDPAAEMVFDDPCVEVAEGATVGDQFAFRLASVPADDVTVTFTVSSASQIQIDNGFVGGLSFGTSFNITFEPSDTSASIPDWDEWVIVNVQALEDNFDEPEPHYETVNITTSSSDANFNGLSTSESVAIYDAAVNLSALSVLPIAEAGGVTTYTVTLNAPPGLANDGTIETVRVRLINYNVRFISVSPVQLDFTRTGPNAWNLPRTITVTGIDDPIDRGTTYLTAITHSTSSLPGFTSPYDSRYGGGGINVTQPRQRIYLTDNDLTAEMDQATYDARNQAAWLDIVATGAVVVEGSSAPALSVRLAGEPAPGEAVVVSLTSVPGVSLSPSEIVFTSDNWNVYQVVNVAVAMNGSAEGGSYTVPVQVVVSGATSAADFLGAADAFQVTVADATAPGVPADSVTAPFQGVPEGENSSEGAISE
jgi:hypothetical protein